MLEFEDEEDGAVAKKQAKKVEQPEVYEDEKPSPPKKQRECDYISEWVGEKIGYHRTTTRVITHFLFDDKYRCNVWAKDGNRNYISHSFFLGLVGEQVVGEIKKEAYKYNEIVHRH